MRIDHDSLIDILEPENDVDPFKWRAVIRGPPDSPYEGGRFEIKIECPEDYPLSPPKVEFAT